MEILLFQEQRALETNAPADQEALDLQHCGSGVSLGSMPSYFSSISSGFFEVLNAKFVGG